MKVESSKIFFILVALAAVAAAVENVGALFEETGTSSGGLMKTPTSTSTTNTPNLSTTTLATATTKVETTTKVVTTTTTKAVTTAATTTTTAVPDFPNQTPPAHQYNVTGDNGKICVLFKATVKLNFNYKMANGTNVTDHVYIPSVEDGTAVNGSCGRDSQSMILSFFNGWNLDLHFVMNSTVNMYYLQHFKLEYDIKNGSIPFPNAENIGNKVANLILNDAWINNLSSYLCISSNILKPSESVPFGLTSVEVANEEYEAFVSLDTPFFTTSHQRCEMDKVSNLIPIIVGAALGALIIIVLVVYLIGRHKSRKGYESV